MTSPQVQTPSISNAINTLNLPFPLTSLEQLTSHAEVIVEDIIREGPSGRAQDSRVPVQPAPECRETLLCIDIGGSNVRVGLRMHLGATVWHSLIGSEIETLSNCGGLNSVTALAEGIAQKLAPHYGLLGGISGVGVVWSNPIKPVTLDGTIRGLSAQALYSGFTSTKGEPFMRSINAGDDLAAPFLASLEKLNIRPRTFVIANDVPLVFTSVANIDGAIVASTGANGTLVIDQAVCNGELGGHISVPEHLLAPPEQGRGNPQLQYLCSGSGICKALPTLIHATAGERGGERLREVSAALQQGLVSIHPVTIRDLVCENFAGVRSGWDEFSRETLQDTSKVATVLLDRACAAAACLAHLSVYGQAESRESATKKVVVESALARGLPGFLSRTQEYARAISGDRLELLMAPHMGDGTISSSMIGAARALDHYFS